MKRHVFLLLALALTLFSCKEKAPEAGNTKEVGDTAPVEKKVENAPAPDAPILGAWLSQAYHSELAKSKSPYATSQVQTSLSEVVVTPDAVVVVHANSEGESLGYEVVNNGAENEVKLSDGTVFSVDDKGLLHSSADGKGLFVKVAGQTGDVSVFEHFVRASLIAGSYNGAPSEVRFDVSGEVTGFGEYVAYRVITRFDDLSDFDMMEFKTLSNETQFMAWEVDGDDLVLYDLIEGGDYVYARGKELYRLTLVSALG